VNKIVEIFCHLLCDVTKMSISSPIGHTRPPRAGVLLTFCRTPTRSCVHSENMLTEIKFRGK
jgi:hypothetical protein